MTWEQKGRERADEMAGCNGADLTRTTAQTLLEATRHHEAWLRCDFADLLAAARWGAEQTRDQAVDVADEAERKALDLLHRGFVGRLREIAG